MINYNQTAEQVALEIWKDSDNINHKEVFDYIMNLGETDDFLVTCYLLTQKRNICWKIDVKLKQVPRSPMFDRCRKMVMSSDIQPLLEQIKLSNTYKVIWGV